MWEKLELEDLAGSLLFGSIKTSKELNEVILNKWQYRKNKGFSDVNNAIKKGIKMGSGKTESEIEWVALYLKDVFKKDRTK